MNSAYKHTLAAMLAFGLLSCSSSHYKVTLRDGREFMAANRPEYSAKTGYYRFRNLSNKDALVRADEVLLITEL
jgi:hypothetical protein